MTAHTWTLPGDDTAAAAARAHVTQTLAGHPRVDDAVQIASELAANAVDHGRPPITLTLDVVGSGIRITTSNASADTVPTPRHASLDDFRGRGLAIVELLAREWGWRQSDDRLDVWAELNSTE